jgi:hypothetical protein
LEWQLGGWGVGVGGREVKGIQIPWRELPYY